MSRQLLKPQLIIEDHPKSYTGYGFITLIQYQDIIWLTVIDNYANDIISAYVLDLCAQENVDEQVFVELVNDWYTNHRNRVPLSVYLSNKDVERTTSRIFKTIPVEYVIRVMGPFPIYPTTQVSTRKKRRRHIP